MLFYLIYTSQSCSLMSSEDLHLLLNESRNYNEVFQISGMLLYMESAFLGKLEGRFIQYLEGTEQEINVLFEKIKKDCRHQNFLVLVSGYESKRQFGNWSMGFTTANDLVKQAPGYQNLESSLFREKIFEDGNSYVQLLQSFFELNSDPVQQKPQP